MKRMLHIGVVLAFLLALVPAGARAARPWDGWVHAPLKTAQPNDWSAPEAFFTGHEGGNLKYVYESDVFEGELRLSGFKQAGPYVLTVDTNDPATLAGYDCDVWDPWADLYGDTFSGGTNGCWGGSPYVDVLEFTLAQYDSDGDSLITPQDYYGGKLDFNVPLLEGTYNLKFLVRLDWHLTSPSANIVMFNDMIGHPKYGKVVQPKQFDYSKDLVISDGVGAEELVLAEDAWCVDPYGCDAPSQDPGYQGTKGVVFYSKVAETFEGVVVLSQTVTPPTPQPLQIKLEGLGSRSEYHESNEALGYIGRWWDNDANNNISDNQYETVKITHDVLGYIIFDGFDTAGTSRAFHLKSSYHTLWTPESGRPAPGEVVMADDTYRANFALTENLTWWRGVFLSENPLEFTIVH
jgi:hypothetical protein